VGVLAGFVLSVFFNEYAPGVLGNETLLYTAFPNGQGGYEIPFLICMGLSFAFTMAIMVAISLTGPAVSARAINLEPGLFRVSRQTLTLIVITLLMITALYAKFW
jgi:SSS family solute:Na+ symporter